MNIIEQLKEVKLNNMSLITFCQVNEDNLWFKRLDQECTIFSSTCTYWVCLPEYEEQCLAWLNGKEVKCNGSLVPSFYDFDKSMWKECLWITPGNNICL